MALPNCTRSCRSVDPYRFFGSGSNVEQTGRDENKQVIIRRAATALY
jgi:hypothetical protein